MRVSQLKRSAAASVPGGSKFGLEADFLALVRAGDHDDVRRQLREL